MSRASVATEPQGPVALRAVLDKEAAGQTHYRRGLALAACGGLCLSFGGLIIRLLETQDGLQILAVRSPAFSATLLLFLLVRYRGRLAQPFRALGWNGWLIVLTMGLGFTCYLYGMLLTTVANVAFIISLSPVFAAIIGWLVLRQRVPAVTGLAIALALAGVAVMVWGGLSGEGLLGMLVAVVAPIGMAILVVSQRRRPEVDLVPAVALGGLVAFVFAMVGLAIDGDAWQVSGRDIALIVLMGAGQVGAGFLLITLGARWLPPAQTTLISLCEAVLAPIWVWLFVYEVPALATVIGGAMIVTAVAGQALFGLSRSVPLARRRVPSGL